MSLSNFLYKYWDGFLSLVYVENCLVCGGELDIHSRYLCFGCENELDFTFFEKYTEPSFADQIFWGRVMIENVYSLLYFQHGNATQKLLHLIKYKSGKNLGIAIGKLIGERVRSMQNFDDVDALIPIPLHPKKEFVRGYNQSMMITNGISETTNIPVVKGLFRKTHDESQTHKGKEERYQNVKDKFDAFPELLQHFEHVAIVDDVLTTGSTLEFAARAIKNHYPKLKVSIITAAIAH